MQNTPIQTLTLTPSLSTLLYSGHIGCKSLSTVLSHRLFFIYFLPIIWFTVLIFTVLSFPTRIHRERIHKQGKSMLLRYLLLRPHFGIQADNNSVEQFSIHFLPSRHLNVSHMQCLAGMSGFFSISQLHYSPLVIPQYFLCINQTSLQEREGSLTQFTQNLHNHQTLQRELMAERSRCSSIRQRWCEMSLSNIEEETRGEGWGYEND